MPSVCFYFQVHQPYRLRNYSIFDIGNRSDYFDDAKNFQITRKVADKCYLAANAVIYDLIKKHKGAFRVSYSITGVALEQFEKYAPEVIESFVRLAETGCVEFVNETYYHSLSYLYSKAEFKEQITMHRKKIEQLFKQTPVVFRNTELIFSDEIARFIESLGFKAVLIEGADSILDWRSPHFVYHVPNTKVALLLRSYKLSDDISFRFSNKDWNEYPLTADKFTKWVSAVNGNGVVINLFMDYETFGEHQWQATGIFEFLKALPESILKNKDNNFLTVSEVVEKYPPISELNIPNFISWADMERDLSAWLGNRMQINAAETLYKMEMQVKRTKDKQLLEDWRRLTTSDHYYYMCTKWFSDGDVHKYFNPYESPYEGFISFMNVLNDMRTRILTSKKEEEMAKKIVSKQSPKSTAKLPETKIKEVPVEKSFFLQDGRILRTLKDLKDTLDTMDDSIFYHHVSLDRNDFANWVRDVFKLPDLAVKIANAGNQAETKKAISNYLSK
ncbi:MAG: polysaccharide deacetylase family protein [bacterium]